MPIILEDNLYKAANIICCDPFELESVLYNIFGRDLVIQPKVTSPAWQPRGKPCRPNKLAEEAGFLPKSYVRGAVGYIIARGRDDPSLVRVQLPNKRGGWLAPMLMHPDFVDLIFSAET